MWLDLADNECAAICKGSGAWKLLVERRTAARFKRHFALLPGASNAARSPSGLGHRLLSSLSGSHDLVLRAGSAAGEHEDTEHNNQ